MFNGGKYITSITDIKKSPNSSNLREFVFLGRSNVGKSSLINALVNMKNLAYTSSNPGKTVCLNYYLIENKFYFVDVPGYGYAKRSVGTRLDFGSAIEGYLKDNSNLVHTFLLVDTKVGMTDDDVLMYNYLVSLEIPFSIIMTKCDKVPTTHLIRYTKVVKENVDVSVYVTSSEKKKGIEEVCSFIKESL